MARLGLQGIAVRVVIFGAVSCQSGSVRLRTRPLVARAPSPQPLRWTACPGIPDAEGAGSRRAARSGHGRTDRALRYGIPTSWWRTLRMTRELRLPTRCPFGCKFQTGICRSPTSTVTEAWFLPIARSRQSLAFWLTRDRWRRPRRVRIERFGNVRDRIPSRSAGPQV